MIEKLILLKKLKKITIQLCFMTNDELLKIQGTNLSVTDMILNWKSHENECVIYGLQNIFPNITYLEINSSICYKNNYKEKECPYYSTVLDIKENKDFKIDRIYLNGFGNKRIAFYCQQFENIKEINIKLENDI